MDVLSLKKYIYENDKIEYILNEIGCQKIKYHVIKDYYSATQPDGDNLMGVVISNNEYLNYRSYSRNIGFNDNTDIISLVESVKKISFIDALKYLHKILNLDFKIKQQYNKIEKDEKDNPLYIFEKVKCKHNKGINVKDIDIKILNESVLNDFISIPYIGWIREGIMSWTCEKFGIAYSYRRKRIIIPHRFWMTGELLGYNSRTTIDNADELDIKKYWITPTYQKSLNLYGLWENKDFIKKVGYIVIFESEKSVLKRDSLGDSSCVALSGHTMSNEQVRIICGLNVEVIIALDNDIPQQEIRDMCEKFYTYRRVSYIYDYMELLGEKDSPADVSNKEYQYLFENRIVYDEQEHKKYLKELKSRR